MFVDLGRLKAFTGSQNYRVTYRRESARLPIGGDLVRAVQRVDFASGYLACLGCQGRRDPFADVREPIAGL